VGLNLTTESTLLFWAKENFLEPLLTQINIAEVSILALSHNKGALCMCFIQPSGIKNNNFKIKTFTPSLNFLYF
jgi:hypothetical protein